MNGRHTHFLADLDMDKINKAIELWVEIQLRQGFSATAIDKVAKGQRERLH
jgi:hypothetical protein